MRTENYDIGGLTYTIKVLNVADTRKLLPIVQRIMPAIVEPDEDLSDLGTTMSLAFTGQLTEAEISLMVEVFAGYTSVDLGDNRTLVTLKKPTDQDAVWQGSIELQYEWLDKCIHLSFEGLIEKSRAVVRRIVAKQKATAEKLAAEKSKSLTESTGSSNA